MLESKIAVYILIMTPTVIIALFFVALGLLNLIRWWRMGFPKKKYPILPFVLVVLAI
jgi:hypothetical protein